MFLTGENDHRVRDGFRAELHDSDGLLMLTGAEEWIWRPLGKSCLRENDFLSGQKREEALASMQRDRTFNPIRISNSATNLAPSYFVEPKGDWGRGRVELIELSTPDEIK